MRRLFFALCLLGLTCSVALGDANIPVKDRVKNQWPGYCCWAAIETVCRHQGVKAGYDLVEKRKLDADYVSWDGTVIAKNFGADAPIRAKLDELGIKYKINPSFGDRRAGVNLIKKAVDSGRGAVVMVYHGLPTVNECHAITIIDIDDKSYSYIDSNTPDVIYEGTIDWLSREWFGFVLIVEK